MCLPIGNLIGGRFGNEFKTTGEGVELRNKTYFNTAFSFFFLLSFCFADCITRLDWLLLKRNLHDRDDDDDANEVDA